MPRKKKPKLLELISETTVLICPECGAALKAVWCVHPRALQKLECTKCKWGQDVPQPDPPEKIQAT